jgi:tRNA threonylcarbamoyladenosine biosynthesis protein TsaB
LKILAIDTATEQCSVALRIGDVTLARGLVTPRGHADLVLPMVQEVLTESGLTLKQMDALAFGRGPGAFTGVRIAVGVIQGLAFAADLPVIGISNLAAVAQQSIMQDAETLVCMDARMGEVYWGRFQFIDGLVAPTSIEQVSAPERVIESQRDGNWIPKRAVGTGFGAYPVLARHFAASDLNATLLPHAREVALLASRDYLSGLAVSAEQAQPVYLRDKVTHVAASTEKP